MATKAGVWIDHKQAIVVMVTDQAEKIERIASEVEKQLQRAGDSPMKGSYEAQQVPADDSRQRAFTEHLNTYYDEVITLLREAEEILILGPGEAKDELRKRLEEKNLDNHIGGVETVDKMTEPQIAARVRAHFAQ